jgi:steroid delta-isomerase-like uncharacterized protein
LPALAACKKDGPGAAVKDDAPAAEASGTGATTLPASGTGTTTPAASGPLALVDAYMAQWNAHDLNKAAAFFAQDVVYFDASVGTPATGFDAGKEVIKSFLTLAPDVKWTRDRTKTPVIQGDSVVYQWTFEGTQKGALSETQPATNKPFKFSGVTIMRFRGGKIVEQSDFYDALGFLSQLGYATALPLPDEKKPVQEIPAAQP